MITRRYKDNLYRADWRNLTAIAPTREQAQAGMIAMMAAELESPIDDDAWAELWKHYGHVDVDLMEPEDVTHLSNELAKPQLQALADRWVEDNDII